LSGILKAKSNENKYYEKFRLILKQFWINLYNNNLFLMTGGATAFSLFPDLGRRSGYEGYNVFSGPRPQVPMPPSSMALSQISPLPMRPAFNGTGFPGSSKLKCKI